MFAGEAENVGIVGITARLSNEVCGQRFNYVIGNYDRNWYKSILKNIIMKLIIKLLGLLIVLIGISLLINPEIIFGWVEDNMENPSLYIFAIVVRLVFGVLFILAAKKSKYSGVIRFFGYLFIIAAIVFIFVGQESFQDFITSLIPDIKLFAPVSGLLSIAFGGFLIYAFSRNNELEQK